jgi:hypothetical protein
MLAINGKGRVPALRVPALRTVSCSQAKKPLSSYFFHFERKAKCWLFTESEKFYESMQRSAPHSAALSCSLKFLMFL